MKINGQCIAVMDRISEMSLHFCIQIVFLNSLYSRYTPESIKGYIISLITTNEFELSGNTICFQINSPEGDI